MKALHKDSLLFLAVLLPLAELYLVRSFYHENPELYVNSGFMIGLFTAAFTLFLLLRDLPLALKKNVLIANALLVLFFLGRDHFIPYHREWVGLQWTLIVGTALLTFVAPEQLWRQIRGNKAIVIFMCIAFASQVFYYLLHYVAWFRRPVWNQFMADYTMQILRWVLDGLGYDMLPAKYLFTLKSPELTLHIMSACSGADAITFFVTIFSLIMMMDYKLLSPRHIGIAYLVGILFMWLLNLVRITAFFIFGVWATQEWGKEKGHAFALDLFHHHVGWVLYALGMGLYFYLFYKIAGKYARKTAV